MSEEQPKAAEPAKSADPSVSITFRDKTTGKNALRIICAVTAEERDQLEADTTGEALIKYVIQRTLVEFNVKAVEPLHKEVPSNDQHENNNVQQ